MERFSYCLVLIGSVIVFILHGVNCLRFEDSKVQYSEEFSDTDRESEAFKSLRINVSVDCKAAIQLAKDNGVIVDMSHEFTPRAARYIVQHAITVFGWLCHNDPMILLAEGVVYAKKPSSTGAASSSRN